MTLLEAARSRVDLRSTGDGEHHGPCPFCDEGHDRFFVHEGGGVGGTGRFYCRRCKRSGNAVGFLTGAHGLSEACARVELGLDRPEGWSKRPWALGVEKARYAYRDLDGAPLLDIVRWEVPPDHPLAGTAEGKTFRPTTPGGTKFKRPDVPHVPYLLPELLEAVGRGEWVLVVEGEKDADALAALGLAATTNEGGAGKWRPEHAAFLRGARVAVLADNDEPGRAHAEAVVSSLRGSAEEVVVVLLPGLPPKGDVSDFLAAGHSADDLRALIERARHETTAIGCTEHRGGLENPPKVSAQDPAYSGPKETGRPDAPRPRGVDALLARFRSAADLAADPAPPTEWVAGRLLPRGALVQLTGATKGGGKTTFLCRALGAVRRGEDFLGEPTVTCPVVYLTEQARSTFEPEYLGPAGLVGDGGFYVLYGYEARGYPFEAVVQAAVEKCGEVGAGVLALDTFGYWSQVDDENDAARVQRVLRPLQDAAASGLCVVAVHHDRKGGGEAWEAGRGSSAFAGAVDVIVNVRRPQGGPRPSVRELRCEGRYGDLFDSMMVELTPKGYVAQGTALEVALAATEGALWAAAPTGAPDAMTFDALLAAVKEVEPAVSRTTLQRALKEAEAEGRVRRVGEGKRGDPYRYFQQGEAMTNDEKPSAPLEMGRGQKETGGDGLPADPTAVAIDASHQGSGTPAVTPVQEERAGLSPP